MLSLLGSLLGFGTSIFPRIFGYFERKQDNAHELAMVQKQAEVQLQIGAQKLDATALTMESAAYQAAHNSDARVTVKASQWVINVSALVRPSITLLFFAELVLLTVAVFAGWITRDEYAMVWNQEIQAVFSAICSFWFGQRTFGKP